jgi:dienelactone hydrolase
MEDAQGYAALFAGMGMPALALAYHSLENLPASINRVPVEIIEKAIDWLQQQSQTDGRLTGIFGCSRGAELALVSASLLPELRFVIAQAPSAFVFEGMDSNGIKTGCSSWTFRDHELPFVPATESKIRMAVRRTYTYMANGGNQTISLFHRALDNEKARIKALIPVEKINGPVLLISGGKDQYWPSSEFAAGIEKRLREYNHDYPVQCFNYPDAGHKIRVPYLPASFRTDGGTCKGNAEASADSWQKIKIFVGSILEIGAKAANHPFAEEFRSI